MPTAVLFDVSLSMGRRLVEVDSTHLELAQAAVLHFLQLLQQSHPLEYTALLSFDSEARVLQPFTRDFSLLRSALYSLRIGDKSSLTVALETLTQFLASSGSVPSDAVLQVVTVVDGRPGDCRSLSALRLPPNCRVHVVALTTAGERLEELRNLSRATQGSFHTVLLPQAAHTLKHSFQALIQQHYMVYQGMVSCGFLRALVTLHPNPWLVVPPSAAGSAARRLPNHIDIVGFIDTAQISSPPSVSRHCIVPFSMMASDVPEPGDESPFLCSMLHAALRESKASAVAKLADDWYGLISYYTEKSRAGDINTALMLFVLKPGADIPWLGSLRELGTTENKVASFPLQTPFPMSYSVAKTGPASIPLVASDSVRAEFRQMLRFSRSLPSKQKQLMAELEKIRTVSYCYQVPQLFDLAKQLLEDQLAQLKASGKSQGSSSLGKVIAELSKPGALFIPLEAPGVRTRAQRVTVTSLVN